MPSRAELGRLDAEARVLAEDRLLQLLQLRSWVEAELLLQGTTEAPIRRERVGLAAAAVERQHELAVKPLAQRAVGDERLQLRHEFEVATESQVGLHSLFECDQPQLLQPRDVGLGE